MAYVGNPELVSRAHFARALVEMGACREVKQVFDRYLTPGKPGYVAHPWPSLEEALGWIHRAGGVAVIAHPGRYRMSNKELGKLLKRFVILVVRRLKSHPVAIPRNRWRTSGARRAIMPSWDRKVPIFMGRMKAMSISGEVYRYPRGGSCLELLE